MNPKTLQQQRDHLRERQRRGEITAEQYTAELDALLDGVAQTSAAVGEAKGTEIGETGLLAGMRVGSSVEQCYVLHERVDGGSFGEVWRARDEAESLLYGQDRWVALKVLKRRFMQSENELHSFQLEAKKLIELRHPHVVQATGWVIDTLNPVSQGEKAQQFLVMEWLQGQTLDAAMFQRRKAGERWQYGEIERLYASLGQALRYAWEGRNRHGQPQQLIHRDLKPANIYLVEGAGGIYPKLLDFGLAARARATGSMAEVQERVQRANAGRRGSEGYIAPELEGGAHIEATPRQDVYALGILLYQLLDRDNRVPYQEGRRNEKALHQRPDGLKSESPLTVEERARYRKVETAQQIREQLNEVIEGAIAYDQGKRIGSAWEMAERLSGALRPPPPPRLPVPPPSHKPPVPPPQPSPLPASPAPTSAAKGKWGVMLATMIGVVLGGFGVLQMTGRMSAPSEALPPAASPAPAAAPTPAPAAPPEGAAATGPKVLKDCAACPELEVLPKGSFKMGSPEGERERYRDEGLQQAVSIDRVIAVGKYPVTRGEYGRFVRATGRAEGDSCDVHTTEGKSEKQSGKSWRNPGFEQGEDHPVVCVNWEDAKAYVSWLNTKPEVARLPAGQRYRLLTEAEWEYAARAGTTSRYWWGEDASNAEQCKFANGKDETKRPETGNSWAIKANCNDGYWYTSPVGKFEPNRWRLHDMGGNAWQWVEDCWADSLNGMLGDGSARTSGCTDSGRRVVRGGSWGSNPQNLRAADRGWGTAVNRFNFIGFRVARAVNS